MGRKKTTKTKENGQAKRALDRPYKLLGSLKPEQVELMFTAAAFSGLVAKEGLEKPIMRTGGEGGLPEPTISLESLHFKRALATGKRVAAMYLGAR